MLASAKALTTRHDLALGIGRALDGLDLAAAPPPRLVSLSTTLATNALVEGRGSPVCLLLVGYGADAIGRSALGRALRGDPVAFVEGGHDASGEARAPLDVDAARAAIERHGADVAAFAVAARFSVRNPGHERAVRDLVRALGDRPVTCSHELTAQLDGPRRALTAVLNARLVALVGQLVVSARALLARRGIDAPLMVVKGDGSLVAAEAALARPVETVLSGPAASLVGAGHLSGARDALVSDIGGTTTDVALLRGGWPVLAHEGATVGGWRTMVEAVSAHTWGLGGDSEMRPAERGGDGSAALRAGPARAVPLALLAHEHPGVLPVLRAQAARPAARDHDGRFALRAGADVVGRTTTGERRVLEALAAGPASLERLFEEHPLERALARLVERGLVLLSAFTPSDALHVLGCHRPWSVEAARLGARLLARSCGRPAVGEEWLCREVVERVHVRSAQCLVASALAEEHALSAEDGGPVGRLFLERALAPAAPGTDPLLDVSLRLRRPVVAVGAPAAAFYPEVARRLGTRLVVPEHAAVCGAVGAAVSGVWQSTCVLVTSPEQGRYRVHLPDGVREVDSIEQARAFAEAETARLAAARARAAGAGEIHTRTEVRERSVDVGGATVFLELEVRSVAGGRPRLA